MAFISELEPGQESLMQSYRETWQEIALSTERIDRQQAINAVFSVYELLELPAPEIQFFDSLYAAAESANPFYDLTFFTEDDCICGTEIIAKLHGQFYPEFINSIGHWDMEIESNLTVNLGLDIDLQLSESIANTLSRPRPFNYELGDDFSRTEWFLPLNWYAHKGGFFDFHFSVASHRLFQPYDERWWQAFQQLVKSCGWIIPLEKICLVCVRVACRRLIAQLSSPSTLRIAFMQKEKLPFNLQIIGDSIPIAALRSQKTMVKCSPIDGNLSGY